MRRPKVLACDSTTHKALPSKHPHPHNSNKTTHPNAKKAKIKETLKYALLKIHTQGKIFNGWRGAIIKPCNSLPVDCAKLKFFVSPVSPPLKIIFSPILY